MIGARYICVELRDMAVFNDDASRRKVTEVVRQVQPELVITASPVDYHPDHEAACTLVRDACFAAGCPNYATGTAPAIDWIPHLYFMDPVEGVDRDRRVITPDFLVDVGKTFATKRNMLACHESQREWLRRHHHMDNYLETMELWTRERGKLLGVEFAEGFRRYHCHPYPQTPLLEELLA
jgi:LmbE family N-acetylglucosaminyl deacetylase